MTAGNPDHFLSAQRGESVGVVEIGPELSALAGAVDHVCEERQDPLFLKEAVHLAAELVVIEADESLVGCLHLGDLPINDFGRLDGFFGCGRTPRNNQRGTDNDGESRLRGSVPNSFAQRTTTDLLLDEGS